MTAEPKQCIIFTKPIKDEVFQCLNNKPSVLQARTIGDRIISKMKEFIEVYVKGMMA